MSTTPRPLMSSSSMRAQLGTERRQRELVTGDVEHVVGLRSACTSAASSSSRSRRRRVGPDVPVAEVVAAPLARRFEGCARRHRATRVLAGVGLRAADESPGQRAASPRRPRTSRTRHERGDVAVGRCTSRLPPAGRSWTHLGRLQREVLEVDHVDVGAVARREHAAVEQPDRSRGGARLPLHEERQLEPAASRSRPQCVSSVVGKLASQIVPTCAPPSPRPDTVFGCASISPAASRLPSA